MIRWFVDLLYGAEPIEFTSGYGLAESIERLRAATVRSVFLSLFRESAVGTVTENRVSLQRVIPLFGNSFKPFFIGRFEMKNGRVVLAGRFTMIWFVKAFMTLWFGFAALWTVLVIFTLAKNPSEHSLEQGWFPLFGVGMIGAGAAFVRFGKWLSRNDTAWLSNIIQSALSGSPSSNRSYSPQKR